MGTLHFHPSKLCTSTLQYLTLPPNPRVKKVHRGRLMQGEAWEEESIEGVSQTVSAKGTWWKGKARRRWIENGSSKGKCGSGPHIRWIGSGSWKGK